jgi:hypothetical protein
MSADLKYLGLDSGLSDGSAPKIQVATSSGKVRNVPVGRRELVRIIRSAAAALEVLDREEGKK